MDYAFNAQADEMLNKAMDELQDQLDSAEGKFESDGRFLEIKAKYANCNDMSVLGDIMAESRRITDELYASYEALIRAANSICKPLADEGVSPASLKRVVDFMKHINSECSTLGSNYSATVNDYSLGNIASTRYSPTAEARMIETNWNLLHSLHPQVAEEKKRAEEAAAKARAEREERERIEREKYAEDYPRLLAEWEAECARIEAIRAKLVPEAEKKAEKDLRYRCKKEHDDAIASANEDIAEQQKIIDEADRIIKSAKFLEFGKKIEANTRKTNALAVVNAVRQRIAYEDQKHSERIAALERNLSRELEKARQQVERENPLPKKPRDPNAGKGAFDAPEGATAVQLANLGIKQEIYETIEEYGEPMTITDIMENCPACTDISNQRCSALVRQLVSDGLVLRTERARMAYFEIA